MKKITKQLLIFTLVITCITSFSTNVIAKDKGYKITKYTSFEDVKKAFLKKPFAKMSGIRYATKKIKTKYGTKKALFIREAGCTDSAALTYIYIKENNKILEMQKIYFVPYSISKNKKYMFVSGSYSFKRFYKYSSGKYKMFKEYNDSSEISQEEYQKKTKECQKQYNLDVNNIDYKHVLEK